MTKPCPLDKTMKIFEKDTNLLNCFKFNQFSERVEYNRSPFWDEERKIGDSINDKDIIYMKYYLTNIHKYEPNKEIIGETCFLVSQHKKYHPVKKYIEMERWDKKPRINEWLIKAVGCDDNLYTRQVSSKFLIATVNRVYDPGCKFDHMIILEGDQGIGKSTLIEELAGDFYLDTTFEHRDKDLVDSICGSMIVEISELYGLNKKDVEWLKGFLTRKIDRVRTPYSRRVADFKRKCVFVGTYNPSGNNMYLRDDTGNRRFWPIECRKIDIKYIQKNKFQLWAEALERQKQKEKYYIEDPIALEIMLNMHAERELETPTFIKIRNWLSMNPRAAVSMMEIIEDCLKINTDGRFPRDLLSVSSPVGQIMRKLGWRKGTNQDRDKYFNPNYKEQEEVWNE